MKYFRALMALTIAAGLMLVAPAAANAKPAIAGKPAPTVVDIALASPDHTILVEAVVKAGFVGILSDPEASFTVFAPTNAAFVDLLGKLGADSLDDIPLPTLQAVLLDHVVGERVVSARVPNLARRGAEVPTIGGLDLTFSASPAMVNDAGIVAVDLKARNGIVHVIDTVLLG